MKITQPIISAIAREIRRLESEADKERQDSYDCLFDSTSREIKFNIAAAMDEDRRSLEEALKKFEDLKKRGIEI